GGRPPSSGAKDQAAVRYVTQLQSELNTVAAVLEDDVSFLQEVQRGEQAVAVDLDPTAELAKLTKKFNMWHREYE
ncbi:MYO3 protein, partial [Haematococcus lacustris]